MQTDLIVAHNFYDNPDEVRDYALKQRYYTPYQSKMGIESGREKKSWQSSFFRSAKDCPFKSSASLISRLEDLVQEEIDMEHWSLGFPVDEDQNLLHGYKEVERACRWNCCFHIKYTQGEKGHGIHNHVTDVWNRVGKLGWSGVIYLNPGAPLNSGLTLWRHKYNEPYEWMSSPDRWEEVDNLANVYNRLVLSRGWIPHSGGPGFGPNASDGRLFQTFFFVTKNPKTARGLRVI